MMILAHRGYWTTEGEKNSIAALAAAFDGDFGVETDLRDYRGRIVISHDVATEDSPPLTALLELHKQWEHLPLALNIKSDGICSLVAAELKRFAVSSYFCFDMSVPDTLAYVRAQVQIFTRRSEFETGSLLDKCASGLWLDALQEPFVPARMLEDAIIGGHQIALVSPELHGKPHDGAWSEWRDVLDRLHSPSASVMLCTDFPKQARSFFKDRVAAS
jgi:hypothetical protein